MYGVILYALAAGAVATSPSPPPSANDHDFRLFRFGAPGAPQVIPPIPAEHLDDGMVHNVSPAKCLDPKQANDSECMRKIQVQPKAGPRSPS